MGLRRWWHRCRRAPALRHDAQTLTDAFNMEQTDAKEVMLRVALAFGEGSVSKGLATLFPDLSPRELFTIATYAQLYHQFEEFKARVRPPTGSHHDPRGVDYVG